MKVLPVTFKRKGWTHEQIYRSGDVAVYRRFKAEVNPHFEVVIVRSHRGLKFGDRLVDASEYYPSSESWGTYGWTIHGEDRAMRKARELAASMS